tara:strand:+ start:60 stop:1271 length:1212 start_codon:yes stop_codon:yes gene_type:complete
MEKFTAQDYQMKTYGEGLQGKLPLLTPLWKKMEEEAYAKMEEGARSYINGGAGLGHTVDNNRNDFNRYRIVPQMLKNVEVRDTSTNLLGVDMAAPFFLCPVGVAEMVHPEGDLAIAKGAAPTGTPYIFSNQGSFPMETCASAMRETPHFFQLYWSKSRALVSSFVKRAEACGSKGIVLTLDTTLLGWRTGDMDIAYLPFLLGKGIAQYTSDPVFRKLVEEEIVQEHPELDPKSPKYKEVFGQTCAIMFTKIYNNSATTWDDLAFLRDQTSLPIILKGILHKDDAKLAVKYGMDGVFVSNHGGRQVDGSISSIAALPKIVKAVKGKIPILMDSGIRGGADVFKALALGADAVGLGRPHIFGLTLAGADGVTEVIRQLQADFELTMALSGCKNVSEINRDCLVKA